MSRMAEAAFGDTPYEYPLTPGFKEGTTSREAAQAVASTAKNLRDQVYMAIWKTGRAGATADEIATRLGRTVLSIRPRVSELHKLERIVPTGERGTNESGLSAKVWKAEVWTS